MQIAITVPNEEKLCVNRKGYHSINVQVFLTSSYVCLSFFNFTGFLLHNLSFLCNVNFLLEFINDALILKLL